MNEYKLTIEADRQPAVLEQLLRVTRYRGFHVISMNSQSTDKNIDIELCVMSERPVSLLKNQLTKLVDVQQVFVDNTQAAHA